MPSIPQSGSSSLRATAVVILFGAFVTGCATSYHIDVDALQNPRAVQSGYSYRIEAIDPSKSSSDAHFEEVAALVRTALSGRGMYEAPDGDEPSVIVELDYGVGPVQTRLVATNRAESGISQRVDPITGRVTSINTDPRMGPAGTMPGVSAGRTGSGYQQKYIFEKYLTIVGRETSTDVATGEPRVELWRVHVTVEDDGDDVSKYITVLAAAAVDYIGTDTQEKQRLRVSETDEVVDFVKQGL